MNLPQHIVIVPDGNRRWAKKRGRPSYMGHRAGAQVSEKILKTALDMGVKCLTMWGASVSNVTERSEAEVKFLFRIFEQYFTKLLKSKDVVKYGVKVNVLGRWEELFPESLKKLIRENIEKTKHYTNHQLTFLMAYSGTDEMLAAVKGVADEARKDPDLAVNAELLKKHLWSHDLPSVDLVIRTGGEPHWSAGMLMWDVAEARLYFTKNFWPDFTSTEFKKAIGEFDKTERRFGK